MSEDTSANHIQTLTVVERQLRHENETLRRIISLRRELQRMEEEVERTRAEVLALEQEMKSSDMSLDTSYRYGESFRAPRALTR